MIFNILNITKKQNTLALEQAKNAFSKDLMFRNWVAMHGGVYVFPNKKTPPNPYLSHIKDRDLTITDGRKLTLMNPAYTVRELMENFTGMYGQKGHITSLKLLNPNNKADEWETKVLENFDKKTYEEYYQIYNYKNKDHLRYMKELKVTQNCLKCHAHQGYKIGDIRGGISITIPMKKYNHDGWIEKKFIIKLHITILIVGLIIALFFYNRIARSIINDLKYNEEIRKKEELINQQSKKALMGEMIDNIIHQWRQPLSIISTQATGVKLKNELELLSSSEITECMDNINDSVQHLSQTINDFRNFYGKDIENKELNLKYLFDKTLKLIGPQFKTSNIEIINNICDINICAPESELIQVLINIINNARDELLKRDFDKKYIFIDSVVKDGIVEIIIKDNAGGIPKNIINKIFENSFTTKKETGGTGIGLHMSRMIVKEHLLGEINVENSSYLYKDNAYTGAKFIISIPLLKEENNRTQID